MLIELIKKILIPIIVDVLVEFIKRRADDPDFRKKSDETFTQIAKAETDAERQDAAKQLQDLIGN
jgi:hypothetical protein